MSSDPPPRRILLVDCDAFFVQVARLEDPEGAGKARLLVVGGASGRGVVTSASYEARAYGVRSAMPGAVARRLCPDATFVPVPRGACVARSRQVKEALDELAPVVQAASIDEFYLDLSGTERLFRDETLERTAWRIREAVLERTKIQVSIGGGTRRIIAKLATGRAKPAGVHIVPPGGELDFLRTLDLADLPGVGPSLAQALARKGLVTVEQGLGVQEEWLQRWYGQRRGAWLYRRMRGMDNSDVDPHEGRKSISSERTFGSDLSDDEDLERRLLELSGSVASTLRRKGFRARTVTVKLRDPDFRTRQHSRTVPEAIESDHAIHAVALELLRDLRAERRVPARLLGVGLTGLLDDDAPQQLGLFEGEEVAGETERDRAVSHAMDRLRDRFGDEAILPGTLFDGPPPGRRRRNDPHGTDDS
ncbi:MAG: DNA polymerase IV [Longimicrobiales bacterium]